MTSDAKKRRPDTAKKMEESGVESNTTVEDTLNLFDAFNRSPGSKPGEQTSKRSTMESLPK